MLLNLSWNLSRRLISLFQVTK